MATNYRVCFCYLRRFRSVTTGSPESIKALFRAYTSDDQTTMSPDQLLRFLTEFQGMKHANLETAREIVNQFRDFRFYIRGGHVRGLSVDSFFRYLFSDHNSPLNPSVSIGFPFCLCVILCCGKLRWWYIHDRFITIWIAHCHITSSILDTIRTSPEINSAAIAAMFRLSMLWEVVLGSLN